MESRAVPAVAFPPVRGDSPLWPEKIVCFDIETESEIANRPLLQQPQNGHMLVIPLLGEGEVSIAERHLHLAPPQWLLLFPFQPCADFYFGLHPFHWRFIRFEMKEASPLEGLRNHPCCAMTADDLDLLAKLTQAWQRPEQHEEVAHWLALILIRMLSASGSGEGGPPARGPDSPLQQRIENHCLKLDEVISLKTLAARMFMSESHLRACFRRETGVSLGRYLRGIRHKKAMNLLAQSGMNITQIAECCGFGSVFAFSRSFRRFSGVTASDYRIRLRGFAKGQNNRDC